MDRILETTARRAKISSTSTPWVRKRVYVQLLKFMPKYDSFEIWPVSQNPLSVEWEWAQFWAPRGKRVYVPLLEFWPMAMHASFMPKYGNFENQILSRKPLPMEQKYAQFRRPGIEREGRSLLLELRPMANLVVKQSAKAHGPLVMSLVWHGWGLNRGLWHPEQML